MEKIVLNKINKDDCTISYNFSVSEGLTKYFSDIPFEINYPENITSVPDSVAVVPFVCNILPVIWLTNSELILKEIDKAFFDCIPEVRKGYETMFPESSFAGNIAAENIVECDITPSDKCGLLFSSGLDSFSSLVSHFDECPDLISIWGSDIRYDNIDGWNIVHKGISESSVNFNLKEVIIRSRFRDFDIESVLNKDFHEQLQCGWWYGVKHSLALLGHVAPYAYLKGYSTLYIASTNCPEDGPVRIASNPITDNFVRFAKCRVIHDGFEYNRQDKIRNVVNFCRNTKNKISLHVCWESAQGSNCCSCEKCYRTMAGLIAEGADPIDYGFEYAAQTVPFMRREMIDYGKLSHSFAQTYWIHIYNGACKNLDVIKKQPYWKHIKWIVQSDFLHPETIKPSFDYRLKSSLANLRIYQALSNLKSAILKK